MDASCIFCRIARHEIDTDVVYEDDHLIAFRDLAPQAPVHILVIPKQHVAGVDDVRADHETALARVFPAAARIARDQGVAGGYRLVVNTGESAGQSVFHLHVHLLGGRPMTWPPG